MRNKSEEEMQKESYEAYLDRLSMPGCPVKLSDEEVEKLIKEGRIKPLFEVYKGLEPFIDSNPFLNLSCMIILTPRQPSRA